MYFSQYSCDGKELLISCLHVFCFVLGWEIGHTDRHQAGQPKATQNVHRAPALLRYHEWYVCKDDKCNKEFEKRCKALGRSWFYDMQVEAP